MPPPKITNLESSIASIFVCIPGAGANTGVGTEFQRSGSSASEWFGLQFLTDKPCLACQVLDLRSADTPRLWTRLSLPRLNNLMNLGLRKRVLPYQRTGNRFDEVTVIANVEQHGS